MAQTVLAARTSTLGESATLALNARAKQLASEGRTIYNLTAGELPCDTPEYIQSWVAKTLDQNKYTPVAGLPELRQKIAKHAVEFYKLGWIDANNIVVCGGAKPALYAALLALVNPGEEVILPTPFWVSYKHLIELAGGIVKEVPLTQNYDLDTEAILAAVSPNTKAVILNSPHNPTGAIFSLEALKALAVGLRDSGVTVISDDIYTKLVYDEEFVLSPSVGFDNVVIINGFSKSQAITGWRIGYLIASDNIVQAVISILSHINGNASVPAQQAAVAAMARDDTPPPNTVEVLKYKRHIVCREFDSIDEIKYRIPGGAFYIFLDLSDVTADSEHWCEQLLDKTGVALVPGEAFAAPGFARLTFVADEATLIKAVQEIKNFIKQGGATK